nr:probable E3 ubiquitin-protein ligase BAH1-like 1 [Tanacetum cinerariifolium]
MKFCKKYEEFMQTQDQKKLPGVGFKNLKKILKRCRNDHDSSLINVNVDDGGDTNVSGSCSDHECPGM